MTRETKHMFGTIQVKMPRTLLTIDKYLLKTHPYIRKCLL
jgi:hypothetical protein